MSDAIQNQESIFQNALEIEDEAERRQFLANACHDQPALLERVQLLLRAHSHSDFLKDRHQGREFLASDLKENQFGNCIGCYKLLEQIGEGGFGVVYMAEQEEPVRRKVALKIIKPGMDTKQVIARFEAERQALAMMDHPNIAKVLDAGTTENGRPYFVMELVRGIPITKFCDQNQLSINERLELIILVCHAIQHAHQKGIIHRDIKPSNVLVTQSHGNPHPMVIDFGVAKAINQRLTEKTLFTNFAQMIGTPAYMSPEQAEMSKEDVDTRSDVYSLGILLYEVLTGTTPFPEERFKEVGYAEMQRIISNEEPLRPSTALSLLNGKSRVIAANRKCEPGVLLKLIKGDLDWIVLKAIDKDRNRRYATPLELVADVERHLSNEAVQAVAPSTVYRFGKFARRNRVVVGVAGLVVAAGLFSSWQAIQATRSRVVASEQAATAQAVLQFMQEDLLGQADPYHIIAKGSGKNDLTLLEAVDRAVQGLGDRYENQPLVEASIHHTIGKAYRRLWKLEEAKTHLQIAFELFERRLGRGHLKTLDSLTELARLMVEDSNYTEAEALCREIIPVLEKQLDPSNDQVLEAKMCLAKCLMWQDEHDEATTVLEEIRDRAKSAIPPKYEKELQASSDLTFIQYLTGHQDVRARMTREDLSRARSVLGTNHPVTLRIATQAVNTISLVEKNFWEADALARETLSGMQQVFGPQHAGTINLASDIVLLDQRRGLNLLERQRSLWKASREYHGPDYVNTLYMQNRLAGQSSGERHFEEAEALMQDSLSRLFRVEGTDTMESRRTMRWMSNIYLQHGHYEKAKSMRIAGMEATRRVMGPEVTWRQARTFELANLHARLGGWKEAAELYREILPHVVDDISQVGAAMLAQWLAGDKEETIQLAEQALLHWDSSNASQSGLSSFAMGLLLVMDSLSNSGQAVKVVEFARDREKPPAKAVLSGLLELRQGQPEQAIATLSDEFLTSSLSRWQSLGQFVRALALLEGGQISEAQETLMGANQEFISRLRRGDLGFTTWEPKSEWWHYAAAIAIRHETFLTLKGESPAPAIDTSFLASQREAWNPLAARLEQANDWARHQDWAAANGIYLDLRNDEDFPWEDTTHFQGNLPAKMVAVWHQTRNFENQEPLVRKWLRHPFIAHDADFIDQLGWMEDLPQDIKEGLLRRSRSWIEDIDSIATNPDARGHRLLNFGIAAWRSNLGHEAIGPLLEAQQAYNLYISGMAYATTAAVYQSLHDHEKAREQLLNADSARTELRESWGDDWGNHWHRLALLEVAIQRVLSLSETNSVGQVATGSLSN